MCFSHTMGIQLKRGRIALIEGPMFAGKSTELLRRMRRDCVAGARPLLVRFAKDTRFGAGVLTRDNDRWDGPNVAVDALSAVPDTFVDAATHIYITEGQFFPDLAGMCDAWAAMGKNVCVDALSGTFEREPWLSVADLHAIADDKTFLMAVCHHCKADAPFSRRLVADTSTVLIDTGHLYAAVCATCWHNAPEDALRTSLG